MGGGEWVEGRKKGEQRREQDQPTATRVGTACAACLSAVTCGCRSGGYRGCWIREGTCLVPPVSPGEFLMWGGGYISLAITVLLISVAEL